MPDRAALRRYDFYKGPQRLDDMWTLRRGDLALRCALFTHSLGWELKLTAGSNFSRSHVCKTEDDVITTSDLWRTEAAGKGWA